MIQLVSKLEGFEIPFLLGSGIMTEKTSQEIFELLKSEVIDKPGKIVFDLAGIPVVINTTDTVGNSIQSWLKEWMKSKNIYSDEPENTQEFPDFFLSSNNKQDHMLEVKAFNFEASPAFDIANYESYVKSVSEKPYRLAADYLVFGYTMDSNGIVQIKKIWLKKIWEIAGKSNRYALNTQIKKDVIYNIRPNGRFKRDEEVPFKCKEDFLRAIYKTQKEYRGQDKADEWKKLLIENYHNYYGTELSF